MLVARLSAPAQAGARPLLGARSPSKLRERLERLLTDRRARYEANAIIVEGDADPPTVAQRVVTALSLP